MEPTLICPKCSRSYLRRDFDRGETYFECEQCQVELSQVDSSGANDVCDPPAVPLASLPNWAPGLLRPSELGSKYGGITLLIAVPTLILAVVGLNGNGILRFLPLLCVISIVAAFLVGYHTQANRNRAAIALMPPPEDPHPAQNEVNPHRAPYG